MTKIQEELIERIRRWCNYQERCTSQLERKLSEMGLTELQQNRIIDQMYEEKFVEDKRFVEAYVSGKIRLKRWGKIKIRFELMALKLPQYLVEEALADFPNSEYLEALTQLVAKKMASVKEEDAFTKNGKVASYCINRGFEADLVWKHVMAFAK